MTLRVCSASVLALVMATAFAAACSSPRAMQPPLPAGEPSVPLYTNLGSHSHPIQTRSPLAQQYFDQGLRLVFGFNHDEARRAFEQAARLDPDAPMPHWGIAYTLGPNYNMPADPARDREAWDAVVKAQAAPRPRTRAASSAITSPRSRRATPRAPRRIAARSTRPTRTPCASSRSAIPTTSTPPRSSRNR